jgi:hypothetical protein
MLGVERSLVVFGALVPDPRAESIAVLAALSGDPCVALALDEALEVDEALLPCLGPRVPGPSLYAL